MLIIRRLEIEGSLETFTFKDCYYFALKTLFGPFKPVIPPNLNTTKIPVKPLNTDQELTVTLMGDIMLNKNLLKSKQNPYQFLSPAIKNSDLVIANLEFPIYEKKPPRGFPKFNGSSSYFNQAVVPLEPSCLIIANNHCLDMGIDGYLATKSFLAKHKIPFTGCNEKDHFNILKHKKNKVALAAFTHSLNRQKNPSTNSVNHLRLNTLHQNKKDLDVLINLVKKMKAQGGLVFLSLHWGLELELAPTFSQVEVAHQLIETGVDLIIGHHPHVLQPLELWPGIDGQPRLIIYSLGNWITNTRKKATCCTTAIKVFLHKNGVVKGVQVFPLFWDFSKNMLLPVDKNNSYPQYYPHNFWHLAAH